MSEILTDTPVKKRMEEEEVEKARKTAKKPRAASKRCQKKTGQTSQKKRGDGPGADAQLTGDNETRCFVCRMKFSMSAEEWICCTSCSAWACISCTDADAKQVSYVCDHCRG